MLLFIVLLIKNKLLLREELQLYEVVKNSVKKYKIN